MRHRLLTLGPILLCAALLPACRRGAPAPEPQPAWSAVVAGDRVFEDNRGGIQDSLRLRIRDVDSFRRLWEQATSRHTSPPSLPSVDFGRDMLLVVAAGRMTPDDQIHVDSIVVRRETTAGGRTEDVLSAVVRITEGCGRLRVDAYPVEIVRVRRFDGPVNFIERREQASNCRNDGLARARTPEPPASSPRQARVPDTGPW